MPDELSLTHYSDSPTLEPLAVLQLTQPAMKPRGLWVSVDGEDDWPAWCRSEQFRDTDAQHRFRVRLADDARILHLTDDAAIAQLSEDFGMDHLRGLWRKCGMAHKLHGPLYIDWQGIIIAPYQWTSRRNVSWYYGWDCASGCIWDAAAIATVDRLEVADA